MSHARRFALAGGIIGAAIATYCIWPQAVADLRGQRTMGPAEVMFVLSLPFSLATWAGWLLPATALFGPGSGQIPRWVAYVWMAMTPPLNWALIGWLFGRWRDRRAVLGPKRAAD